MERMMDFVRRTWPNYEITEESLQPMWDRYLSGFSDHILVDALRAHKADEPDKRGPAWRVVRKIAYDLRREAATDDLDEFQTYMRLIRSSNEWANDAMSDGQIWRTMTDAWSARYGREKAAAEERTWYQWHESEGKPIPTYLNHPAMLPDSQVDGFLARAMQNVTKPVKETSK